MGGTALPTFAGGRIANATRTWQAVQDAVVTGWDKTADLIVALAASASAAKPTPAMSLQLRWRNVTDSGAFAALSASGELTWTATTDLANANAVTTGEAGCTGTGTWADGVEREGANAVAVTLATGTWSEWQWAIDVNNAGVAKEYAFELYDATSATSIGTTAATLTTASASVTDVTTIQTLRTDVVNLKTPVLVTERSPSAVGSLRSMVLNPRTPVITTERSPTTIVTRALLELVLKTPVVTTAAAGTDATISVAQLTELLQLQSPSVAALRNPTTIVSRVLETFVLKTPVVFTGQLVNVSALKALLALQAPVVVASRSPTMVMVAGGLRLTTKAPKVTIVGVSTGRRGAHRQRIRGAIAGHRGGM